ncbi:glycosyl transferase [Nadsonia fulvescens var. elongata DSM 6958]|uniref:Alpha-1,4 glucan phosphorylase n=1 Tax=Nadsonia fulvescens var. elongata DSM 6958 TaxID=857566 RepID=A0A1E3PQD2_9ASCO|nr:glycosyl transferase [Nadsonia fulvescens var. elongata DSM 6958]
MTSSFEKLSLNPTKSPTNKTDCVDDDFVAPLRSHKRTFTGFTQKEMKVIDSQIPIKFRETWKKFVPKPFETKEEFQKIFINHVETTLARSLYNCDDAAAFEATALSARDKLISSWNKTQQKHSIRDPKRVYYLSLEFLMGRALDNALLNTETKGISEEGINDFGFRMEDVLDQEPDAALGNGGLGRLAACFMDSLTSTNQPGWGYGLRYQYGIFKQKIVDGYQVEQPDYWLTFNNPWEIPRKEISVDIMFYGYVRKYTDEVTGKQCKTWEGGDLIKAVAYDFPVPGYGTKNTNNLRLWSSVPTSEFDFQKFNDGDYESSVSEQQKAETITAVLYPNDNFYSGKELRLKQQYFWVTASLHDILRRFKKSKRPWKEFPDQVAIQLNDTHPTIAIVELQRILVDLEHLSWDEAWDIVTKTFGYTNHTVLPEALEKWPVDLFGNLLPRHLEIIYDINLFFLQKVEKLFPNDREMLSRVSVIEESNPRQVRMAYLAIIGSHKVNGVAELHSKLIQTSIFKDFVKIYGPDKFTNVTNGITPRRWLNQANPLLSKLISEKLGGYGFLTDLDKLTGLKKYAHDKEFQARWIEIKNANKRRLADLIKSQTGIEVNNEALFDIQVKRIHEYKRQQLNILGVVHRYLTLKAMSKEERSKQVPRVVIIGGKSAPGYYMAKVIIKLVTSVGAVVNNDEEIGDLLKVIFIEDYNVSKAEIITPASDISQHISTAGTEASGTSNMKFVLNGGLILGTVDGANVEITREIGEDNIFLFGHLAEDVEDLRHKHRYSQFEASPNLAKVFEVIESGMFGHPGIFTNLINSIRNDGDHYLVNDDFQSYLDAQDLIDKEFVDKDGWASKSINSVAGMGFFSSDRAILEYADSIWNIEALPVEES